MGLGLVEEADALETAASVVFCFVLFVKMDESVIARTSLASLLLNPQHPNPTHLFPACISSSRASVARHAARRPSYRQAPSADVTLAFLPVPVPVLPVSVASWW